jgi:hypothetical protein
MSQTQIWKMSVSCEIGRPQIGETGYWDEWDELKRPFPNGVDTLRCEKLLEFRSDASDALEWDYYGRIGDVWSQRAKDLLWPYANKHLRCFQTTLNGAPYYILRTDAELGLDCLDFERSKVEYFQCDSNDVKYIHRHYFHLDRITAPLIFFVPEKPILMATDSIRQMVEAAKLKGFLFSDPAKTFAERANSGEL